jgi:RecA/RadA recombinase
MLVYAVTLWLSPTVTRDAVVTVIAGWLSGKTKTPLSVQSLSQTGEPRMRDSSRVSVVSLDGLAPELWAMRYAHADSEVSGRRWTTEIGMRRQRPHDPIECSVVVQTSEISTRVTTPALASRPIVVCNIAASCALDARTPGREIRTLHDDADEAEAFLYGVEDERRKHAYILVSPAPDGKYLVDAERLRSLLVGLADVVVISPSSNTFFLEKMLGRQFAAWRGAVNVIFPQVRFPDRTFIETRVLVAEQLTALAAKGIAPETEILSIITHRTNLPTSWRAISLDRVHEAVLRRELALRLQEAKKRGDQDEYIRLLEENDAEQAKKIADLEIRNESLEDELSTQRDVERRLRYELERLKESVSGEDRPAIPADQRRDHIVAVLEHRASPEETLGAIASLFADRIVVLPSAWKSVKKSANFRERDRVAELLLKLAVGYWLAMVSGSGDAEAGRPFGSAYAARESETVEANPQARKRRTFAYPRTEHPDDATPKDRSKRQCC